MTTVKENGPDAAGAPRPAARPGAPAPSVVSGEGASLPQPQGQPAPEPPPAADATMLIRLINGTTDLFVRRWVNAREAYDNQIDLHVIYLNAFDAYAKFFPEKNRGELAGKFARTIDQTFHKAVSTGERPASYDAILCDLVRDFTRNKAEGYVQLDRTVRQLADSIVLFFGTGGPTNALDALLNDQYRRYSDVWNAKISLQVGSFAYFVADTKRQVLMRFRRDGASFAKLEDVGRQLDGLILGWLKRTEMA